MSSYQKDFVDILGDKRKDCSKEIAKGIYTNGLVGSLIVAAVSSIIGLNWFFKGINIGSDHTLYLLGLEQTGTMLAFYGLFIISLGFVITFAIQNSAKYKARTLIKQADIDEKLETLLINYGFESGVGGEVDGDLGKSIGSTAENKHMPTTRICPNCNTKLNVISTVCYHCGQSLDELSANEWKCPNCGTVNQNHVGTCKCGHTNEKEHTLYGSDTINCPKCGAKQKADSDVCYHCSYVFEEKDYNNTTVQVTYPQTKTCPNCNTKLNVISTVCYHCGQSLDELSANEWKCPNCGTVNQNYVGTCKCGHTKQAKEKEHIPYGEETKVCPHCGAKQKADRDICYNCEHKLD